MQQLRPRSAPASDYEIQKNIYFNVDVKKGADQDDGSAPAAPSWGLQPSTRCSWAWAWASASDPAWQRAARLPSAGPPCRPAILDRPAYPPAEGSSSHQRLRQLTPSSVSMASSTKSVAGGQQRREAVAVAHPTVTGRGEMEASVWIEEAAAIAEAHAARP